MLQQSNRERNFLQQTVVKSPNSHMKKKTIKPWPLTHKIQKLTQTVAASLQSCPTLCDPRDGSPPGSPVPGILQAWTLSRLPFPSPVHESEKWKWSRSVVSNPQRPYGLQPTRLLRPWDSPGKSTGVGCRCLLHNSIYIVSNSRWHQRHKRWS